MIIRQFFSLKNGKYNVTLRTEDFSEADVILIRKFGEPEIDLGGTFTLPEITGTHTGVTDPAVLTDSSADFTPSGLIGRTVTNDTDGSSGVITANTATTVTVVALAGGSDNQWESGDAYTVEEATFSVDPRLERIQGQSPFSILFDIRDVADAEDRANTWATEVTGRIQTEMAVLRSNDDDFSREDTVNV